MAVALAIGLRRGEALGLPWIDADPARRRPTERQRPAERVAGVRCGHTRNDCSPIGMASLGTTGAIPGNDDCRPI